MKNIYFAFVHPYIFIWSWGTCYTAGDVHLQRELSYRKQIARNLRTHYVEDIYRPKYYTVTLKFRLRVTEGHRNRNIG